MFTVEYLQQQDDKDLVSLYIQGNENAFAVLLHRHKNGVFSFITQWIKDRNLAQDLFQETFFKAIRTLKSGEYKEEGRFFPWLIRIARNIIIDYHRRNHRLVLGTEYENEEGESFSLFDLMCEKENQKKFLSRELRSELRKYIRRLPKEQRDVLIQRIWFEMSFQEIAEFSGVSINTALGRMRYALINLRKLLEKSPVCEEFQDFLN
jgi:RNA polymerase sigma-70 factor (ECF subfamily)